MRCLRCSCVWARRRPRGEHSVHSRSVECSVECGRNWAHGRGRLCIVYIGCSIHCIHVCYSEMHSVQLQLRVGGAEDMRAFPHAVAQRRAHCSASSRNLSRLTRTQNLFETHAHLRAPLKVRVRRLVHTERGQEARAWGYAYAQWAHSPLVAAAVHAAVTPQPLLRLVARAAAVT